MNIQQIAKSIDKLINSVRPPKITFNVNNKKLVHFSYERYLENKIRESFDLEGTPIQIEFKNRGEE